MGRLTSIYAEKLVKQGYFGKRIRHKATGLEGQVCWDGRDWNEGLEMRFDTPIPVPKGVKSYSCCDNLMISIPITDISDFEVV